MNNFAKYRIAKADFEIEDVSSIERRHSSPTSGPLTFDHEGEASFG